MNLENLPDAELAEFRAWKEKREAKARAGRFGLGFLFGAAAVLAIAAAFLFFVVNPKTKALAAQVTNQSDDDNRLLKAARKLDAKAAPNNPPFPAEPPTGLNVTQHEWNLRQVVSSMQIAEINLDSLQRVNSIQNVMLQSSLNQQANAVVAAGGTNSTKGRQELAVLLDLIRPGLGRLVVQP